MLARSVCHGEGWRTVGDGVGRPGVWLHGSRGDDPRTCGGVFLMGSGDMCVQCKYIWMGTIGACDRGVGGVFSGFCKSYPYPLSRAHEGALEGVIRC